MSLNPINENINLKDNHTFRTVFDQFYVPLCLFAEKYVKDDEQANDIVQDCFLKLWQLRGDFIYLHQIKSFLYTSVRNKALNELKHHLVVQEYAQNVASKESDLLFHNQIIEEETHRLLYKIIETLPRQTKAVINYSLKGLSNKEIAETLAISAATVYSLKKVAYRKLREMLKGQYYLF